MAWWKQTIIAMLLVGATLGLWSRHVPGAGPFLSRIGLPTAEGAAPEMRRTGFSGPGPATVVGAVVAEAEANGRVTAIGDGKALHSVSVTPMAPGRLVALNVRSGDTVKSGDLVAQLDREAEAIELDRARLALEDARTTLARVQRLRKTDAATDVQVSEAELALGNAALEVRDAELALARRDVTAPIGGTIGLLPIDPGSQVDTGSEIATIDDRTSILVDFRVPERFAGRIAPGDPVVATALARPELDLVGRIVGVDSRVDATSRTLAVQASLANGQDLLRGGMAFAIELTFAGERYPAVDPLAIQWSAEGAFVWVGRDGQAVRTPVRIIQRDSDRVLVSGALVPGERVIVEGLQRLRDGAAVRFDGDPPSPPDAGAADG